MTIRELAKLAGLGKSTVAYALKDDPRISAAVRERVQELAREQGYVPNPLVNAFMHAVRRKEGRKQTTSIAYLMGGLDRRREHRWAYERLMIEGALEKAAALGFNMELIAWEAEGLSEGRLKGVLQARGIRGVFLGPAKTPHQRMALDWNRFAMVASGYTYEKPLVDRVAADLFESVNLAIRRALERGYASVGLLIDSEADERVGHRWLSGGLVSQYFATEQVWILRGRNPELREMGIARAREARPCALIASWAPNLRDLSKETEGYVALDQAGVPEHITAIEQPHRALGERAVTHLANLIDRGVWGEPTLPCRITLSCGWREGKTLQPQPKK